MGQQEPATDGQMSKCSHPEAVGNRWGDPIRVERQAELQAMLDAWNARNAEQVGREEPDEEEDDDYDPQGPYTGVELTAADVSWLAELSGRVKSLDIMKDAVPNLHLEGANLSESHLEGARLEGAHLEGANFIATHLEGADLIMAHMKGAYFVAGRLEDALLSGGDLEGTDFTAAHLEGAYLFRARLEGADLRQCWLDSRSVLREAILDHRTQLGDIHWNGVGSVDLTQVAWENVPILGDELGVGLRSDSTEHTAVFRAYRQLAAQLRAQGLSEAADRFAHRARERERMAYLSNFLHDWRHPWRWPMDISLYLGSFFLALLAGYGYRPGRTLFWYVTMVLSFMGGYWLVTHGISLFGLSEPAGTQPLHWYEALVLSVASFHGRGFFPQGINLGDPVAILAASEAVIGLFIEISFIATFTQRYFAR